MPGRQRMWVYSPSKKPKDALSSYQKEAIEKKCNSLIEYFKKECIKEKPDKRFNYTIDIFLKWRGNSLSFIQKMRCEQKGYPTQDFNAGFARIDFMGKDWFNLYYFRHTDQWYLLETGLSLADCIERIENDVIFHPVGQSGLNLLDI